ncbi:hypothetical protein CIHG_03862 [Coccidioides immitis H538.4]|uniref:Uncharacterized protein n=1 Tax=Coccidioides immitis H538.4 TaxID=396776 RepID=A0A0J8RNB4_COCIT|nr:hypothetical protein CIHG_03862 [Coccidioides immitis H538.4]
MDKISAKHLDDASAHPFDAVFHLPFLVLLAPHRAVRSHDSLIIRSNQGIVGLIVSLDNATSPEEGIHVATNYFIADAPSTTRLLTVHPGTPHEAAHFLLVSSPLNTKPHSRRNAHMTVHGMDVIRGLSRPTIFRSDQRSDVTNLSPPGSSLEREHS